MSFFVFDYDGSTFTVTEVSVDCFFFTLILRTGNLMLDPNLNCLLLRRFFWSKDTLARLVVLVLVTARVRGGFVCTDFGVREEGERLAGVKGGGTLEEQERSSSFASILTVASSFSMISEKNQG